MHGQLVAEHGGLPTLRDRGLLISALAAARNHFTYGEKDLCALAAAYAYALTRKHPFADSNKRTAFLAAYTFLGINDVELDALEEDVVKAVVGLSARTTSVEDFAAWLRKSCAKTRTVKRRRQIPRGKRKS